MKIIIFLNLLFLLHSLQSVNNLFLCLQKVKYQVGGVKFSVQVLVYCAPTVIPVAGIISTLDCPKTVVTLGPKLPAITACTP